MAQTLSQKESIKMKDLYNIGVCIIDEVHSIPTKCISTLFFKIPCKYIYGLTATLERKDNLHKIVELFIGDILYTNLNKVTSKKQETIILVKNYNTGITNIPTINLYGNIKTNIASLINQITEDQKRNEIIIELINSLIEKYPYVKILCMSDRIAQLRYLHKKLENSGLFIGNMKNEQLNESKKKNILLATYSMVIQGFDCPELNCLVLLTPRSNVIQAIGRIYRKVHENIPIIVDIVDNDIRTFKNQYNNRKTIYKKEISKIIWEDSI